MKNIFQVALTLFGILCLGAIPNFSMASAPTILVTPEKPIQGEPVMIVAQNSTIDEIAQIIWNKRSLWFFNFKNQPTAIIALDLDAKTGPQKIVVRLENKTTIEKIFLVSEREKIKAPLGIPEKLGGDTPEAQTKLVTNLAKENTDINNVFSASKRFWSQPFRYPTSNPQITDTYGYLRQTGYYNIPHKGSDFKAPVGTKVFAVNRGVVRLAKNYQIYGNTIAIDHGLGVVSYYMHLSKIDVETGALVGRGAPIGLSGETGYALNPHLHLSIKINGISIDPAKFIELFK